MPKVMMISGVKGAAPLAGQYKAPIGRVLNGGNLGAMPRGISGPQVRSGLMAPLLRGAGVGAMRQIPGPGMTIPEVIPGARRLPQLGWGYDQPLNIGIGQREMIPSAQFTRPEYIPGAVRLPALSGRCCCTTPDAPPARVRRAPPTPSPSRGPGPMPTRPAPLPYARYQRGSSHIGPASYAQAQQASAPVRRAPPSRGAAQYARATAPRITAPITYAQQAASGQASHIGYPPAALNFPPSGLMGGVGYIPGQNQLPMLRGVGWIPGERSLPLLRGLGGLGQYAEKPSGGIDFCTDPGWVFANNLLATAGGIMTTASGTGDNQDAGWAAAGGATTGAATAWRDACQAEAQRRAQAQSTVGDPTAVTTRERELELALIRQQAEGEAYQRYQAAGTQQQQVIQGVPNWALYAAGAAGVGLLAWAILK